MLGKDQVSNPKDPRGLEGHNSAISWLSLPKFLKKLELQRAQLQTFRFVFNSSVSFSSVQPIITCLSGNSGVLINSYWFAFIDLRCFKF